MNATTTLFTNIHFFLINGKQFAKEEIEKSSTYIEVVETTAILNCEFQTTYNNTRITIEGLYSLIENEDQEHVSTPPSRNSFPFLITKLDSKKLKN